MNEFQFADLFSEQIDRMLQGERPEGVSNVDDLQELLELGKHISQTQFQASTATQAAFQSQLTGWFGIANGGSPMTILGLSKAWFISIIVTTVAIVIGGGFIAVIVSTLFIFGSSSQLPPLPPITTTAEAETTGTPTPIPTEATTIATTTVEPDTTPTVVASTTPYPMPDDELPPLIFISQLSVVSLCQGSYVTQSTLVNYGNLPVTDAALAWEVIEGAELVDNVNINSAGFETALNENEVNATHAVVAQDGAGSDDVNADNGSIDSNNYAYFQPISVEQKVKLGIKIKVNDDWWHHPDGTEIKIKLSVKNKVKLTKHDDSDAEGDRDRGHGNDPDGYDEDNPGRGHQNNGSDEADHDGDQSNAGQFQIVTIVKQGAEWITLSGIAHEYGDQSLLVDGHIVIINNCSGLPPALPPGSNVEVTGVLLPDGTFIAINIIIINIDIISGDFDSGKPLPGGSDSDKGGSKGGKKGGSKGGNKGGSRGGSHGGSRK